jgi:hypothetical protein
MAILGIILAVVAIIWVGMGLSIAYRMGADPDQSAFDGMDFDRLIVIAALWPLTLAHIWGAEQRKRKS